MAELKTKPTDADVAVYLDSVAPDRRADCLTLVGLMRDATGEEPVMWGSSMVGFGHYRYKGASGREGEWFLTGFAPRKNDLTLYIMAGFERYAYLMAKLGKHKTGKSCLYVKSLADVDMNVLRQLVTESVEQMAKSSL